MEDGRSVSVAFAPVEGGVNVTESFDAENSNPAEMQRQGWQCILDRFCAYVEAELMQQRMVVLEGIAGGEQAIAEGRVATHDQAKKHLAEWLK
jgi:predicted transcriptional regulator